MKRILLFAVFLMVQLSFGQTSIWTNPITGTNPNTSDPYTTGQTVDPNITVSGIRRSTGIAGANANNIYNASDWNTSNGIDLNDYYEFTLTPNAGYEIDLTSFVYTSTVSATNQPTGFAFRSSIDGFANNIGTSTSTGTTINLSAAAYQNIISAITFRIYAYGSVSNAGTFGINDFTFNGTVSCNSNLSVTGTTICQGGSGSLNAGTTITTGATKTISGSWDTSINPTALRPGGETTGPFDDTTTCLFIAGEVRSYVATSFQVTTTGNYSFVMTNNANYDGMGYIYRGNFVPGNCSGGGTFIRGDDDTRVSGTVTTDEPSMFNVPLTAGVTYTLVTTTWSTTTNDSFIWTVTPPSGGNLVAPSWYTTATGGSAIGTGSPFNPVGVPGSGLSNTNTAGTTTFYAGFPSISGCRTAANFVINPSPQGSLTANGPFCVTGSGQLTWTATAGTGPYTVVYNDGVANRTVNNVVSGTPFNTFTTPVTATTTYNLVSVANATCTRNTGFTVGSAIITVNPTSAVGAVSADQTICSGSSPSSNVTIASATGTIQWQRADDAAFTTNLTNVGTNSTTLTIAEIGALTATTYYRAVVQNAGCNIVNSSIATITIKNPVATGVTICQGATSVPLTASASCVAVAQTPQVATGTGGTSESITYGGSGNTNITINFPALPAGAIVTNTTTTITYTSNYTSWLDELRIEVTPPVTVGGLVSNLQPSTSPTPGTLTNQSFGSWGTGSPVGSWLFRFREDFNDAGVNPDANIANVTITVAYTLPGTLDWFTTASGGTKIYSGSSFDPVGVAGSGLTNTNTAGTTSYYVACSDDTTCRTRVDYVITPAFTAPTVETITNVTCSSTTGSVVLSGLQNGWIITQSGTATGSYTSSGTSYTVTGLAVGNYTFRVNNGTCTSASTLNVPIADASSTTWNGSSWSNGAPDASKNIIIASSSGAPFAANLTGCALTINNGVTATVPSGVTLTITNAVTTNGQLIFENNASLVQTTNVTNTGAIEYRRKSAAMKNFDYTYWSSPVSGPTVESPVLGQTAKLLSPNTLADKYFRFDGDVAVNDWVFDDGVMTPGVGFIIRVPKPGTTYPNGENWNTPTYSQPVAFKGTPNNGNYFFLAGANELNLIGNPYPSAIRADDFINANTSIIYGALYFWTHNTAIAPSGSNYVYTADDYATYNITGGTAGGPLPIPVSGPAPSPGLNTSVPNGFIAAGQSFFVENAAAGSFQFTNAMRATGNNSQFFKQANTKKTATVEKNRVWLNLTNSGGAFKQLLVGYITGATNDWDNMYDGPTFDGQEFVDFYSVNQGKNLTIQGRALPFVDTDVVPLGYRSTIAGSFDISIDNKDGSLAGQAIWLEDKKTNTLHELSKGKYTFTAINGVENDRFVLKYTGKTLGTDDNEVADKSLIVSVKNKKITLTSSAEAITQVQLFDLLGRKVYDKSKINAQEWSISNLPSSEQTLIVKTTLANGAISNKKIIY